MLRLALISFQARFSVSRSRNLSCRYAEFARYISCGEHYFIGGNGLILSNSANCYSSYLRDSWFGGTSWVGRARVLVQGRVLARYVQTRARESARARPALTVGRTRRTTKEAPYGGGNRRIRAYP
jgi:hypothetical protein